MLTYVLAILQYMAEDDKMKKKFGKITIKESWEYVDRIL